MLLRARADGFLGETLGLQDLGLVEVGGTDRGIGQLLALTFVVGAITLGSGRTNMMPGAIHLIIFAAFLFLTLVP